MKNLFPLIIICSFLMACNHTHTAIKERIENADSAAINYFKGDGTMDTVVVVKIIRDKEILQQLTNFISASTAKASTNCGADGSLHFFKKNMVVQDIDFIMEDKKGCMQFTFKLDKDEPWSTTKLSAEAKALLQSLNKKP